MYTYPLFQKKMAEGGNIDDLLDEFPGLTVKEYVESIIFLTGLTSI